jgi:hypothetical protein
VSCGTSGLPQVGIRDRPHHDRTLDRAVAIVHLPSLGLRSEVGGDRSGLVRRERDDDRALVSGVRDQEDAAVEVHPGDDLNLKRRLDVLNVEVQSVSVPPCAEPADGAANRQPAPARCEADAGNPAVTSGAVDTVGWSDLATGQDPPVNRRELKLKPSTMRCRFLRESVSKEW